MMIEVLIIYVVTILFVFILITTVYYCFKCVVWLICGLQNLHLQHLNRERNRRASADVDYDRQGNVFTISDGASANGANNRYPPDFFYLDANNDDAARIRSQLEKDDKELPSYEEVMRITAMAEANAANTSSSPATDGTATRIAVPPYAEVDPNPIPALPQADEHCAAVPAPALGTSASTSRAAAVANTPSSSVV